MRWRSLWLSLLVVCAAAATAGGETVLVVGDSLSAAYGIDPGRGWVSLLRERLKREGYPHAVVNASISGETTLGARTRLPDLLERHRPEVVLIGLGGNDGLRGIAPREMRENLEAMAGLAREAGARVVIAAMRLPPNYGPAYTERFEAVFRALEHEAGLTVTPFMLEGVADRPDLMQGDGIHPRASAQPRILENLWPALTAVL